MVLRWVSFFIIYNYIALFIIENFQVKDKTSGNVSVVRVEFNPTVPHCSLATLIGLCIRIKLERSIPYYFKLDIYIKEGAHTTEHESRCCCLSLLLLKCVNIFLVNKQINDKERIAAAMENPNLKQMVETCIAEED